MHECMSATPALFVDCPESSIPSKGVHVATLGNVAWWPETCMVVLSLWHTVRDALRSWVALLVVELGALATERHMMQNVRKMACGVRLGQNARGVWCELATPTIC